MDPNDNAKKPTLRLCVLSQSQIDQLFRASLACLERTGVNVLNAQARDLLSAAGARVEGERVRIPPYIIQDAIAASPGAFSLWGRDPRHHLQVMPGRVHFGPGPSCTYYVDPASGERRRAGRGDPGLTARVCDALENIDYVMGLALPDDVTPELAPVYEFAAMVANTGKPILAWAYSPDNLAAIYRIAIAAAGGEAPFHQRPFVAYFVTSQPPLIHTDAELASAFWAADHGLPVVYLGGGCAGVTAPISGAGAVIISLAATLSALAIIQLHRRGAPVCLGSVPSALDPRTGRPAYGSPEMSLYSAAVAEVLESLGLPFMGTAGASEAKTVDTQAAVEGTVQVIFSLLSGTALPHDVGFLDCADIGSLEMLVLSDEIIGLSRRITRGLEVDDTAPILDLIDQVGPGGEFISLKETARGLRQEVWISSLMDRQPWEGWQASGARSMGDRIRERLRGILASHEPPPLPEGAAAEIEEILGAAEESLARVG
jgi:trimethylamine--corrinoid protein Co-methyltransferase